MESYLYQWIGYYEGYNNMLILMQLYLFYFKIIFNKDINSPPGMGKKYGHDDGPHIKRNMLDWLMLF